MKKNLIFVILSGIFLFVHNTAKSQDFTVADPAHCKVLADTNNVKMYLLTLHPGEQTPPHTHATRMFYCLTEGKLSRTANGKTTVIDLKPGMNGLGKPVGVHTDANVGTTDITILLVNVNEDKQLSEVK
jgi:beta-alanine degradation protein BauB